MKWDAVVLTACDVEQKHAFEIEIAEILHELNDFAERFLVVDDRPSNIRIGMHSFFFSNIFLDIFTLISLLIFNLKEIYLLVSVRIHLISIFAYLC